MGPGGLVSGTCHGKLGIPPQHFIMKIFKHTEKSCTVNTVYPPKTLMHILPYLLYHVSLHFSIPSFSIHEFIFFFLLLFLDAFQSKLQISVHLTPKHFSMHITNRLHYLFLGEMYTT